MIDPRSDQQRLRVVLGLGTTQTLAWASSFYLPAILAKPMAHDLAITETLVFAVFSVALLIAAMLGPRVGHAIDNRGGRGVLVASNVLLAAGLAVLAAAHGLALLWLAWLLIGVGMGLGLYDAAFAALGRYYGTAARGPITGITLMAGFASTIGWPLSAWGVEHFGWRETCLGWAAAHMLIGLPLNALVLPRVPGSALVTARNGARPYIAIDRNMLLIGFAVAAGWAVASAMAAHMPRILMLAGASDAQSILAGALFGPAQVAARLIEASLMQRHHPLLSARLSALAHPLGCALIGIAGTLAMVPFALLHGAGNGILTIARGTVPLAVYGSVNYGYRLGLLGAPARATQAIAPLAFGLLIERMGINVLYVTAALGLATFAAFSLVETAPQPDNAADGSD